jgi:hypothetical protein
MTRGKLFQIILEIFTGIEVLPMDPGKRKTKNLFINDEPDSKLSDNDPLAVFLGKWFLLDFEGNIDNSNSYIEIYPEGLDYRFDFKYYGTMEKGYLKFEDETKFSLNKDDGHVDYILGQPLERDNTLVFFVDSEGPLGFFQRESTTSP